jgi:hypothetical protein
VSRRACTQLDVLSGGGVGSTFLGGLVMGKLGAVVLCTLGAGAEARTGLSCTLGGNAGGGGYVARLRICATRMKVFVVLEPYMREGTFVFA